MHDDDRVKSYLERLKCKINFKQHEHLQPNKRLHSMSLFSCCGILTTLPYFMASNGSFPVVAGFENVP